jgi:cell division septation protein DedD
MQMHVTKKDWVFIALVVIVMGVFIAISGQEKTKKVPFDDTLPPQAPGQAERRPHELPPVSQVRQVQALMSRATA